jgi:hypothetical protein
MCKNYHAYVSTCVDVCVKVERCTPRHVYKMLFSTPHGLYIHVLQIQIYCEANQATYLILSRVFR